MREAMKIEVMKTPLARARGRGASHSGLPHWVIERITAIALIPLTLWFIYATLHLVRADYPTVAHWVAHPVNTVLLLALIAMTFHHMQLGLQVIMEDYIEDTRVRTVSLLANRGAALVLGLLCAVSVLRLAFTA
jgi:succinate dehydrogenase / fumarate reductase membrane anchor subunit